MSDNQDDGYDESEHAKEVYAHFGLAYYQSSVVESGIANALLYGEFITEWRKRIERDGQASFVREVYEAEFDAFWKSSFL